MRACRMSPGGSLAGTARLPWATFEQKSGGAQLIFVRAFKNGRVGHARSGAEHRPLRRGRGSVDRLRGRKADGAVGLLVRAECGPGRQEPNLREPLLRGRERHLRGGQHLGARGAGSQARACPSLNIHTDKEAENPSVAGGAAVAGADPVPWVAWQEEDGNVAGSGNHDQIFVSKGVKQAAPKQPCTELQALRERQRGLLLLAAGGPRPARREWRFLAPAATRR